MRQIIPSGPAFPRPSQTQLVAFEFMDENTEQRCYAYVAANAEPIRTLHRAMNAKVERGSEMFFVCADVWLSLSLRECTRRSARPAKGTAAQRGWLALTGRRAGWGWL